MAGPNPSSNQRDSEEDMNTTTADEELIDIWASKNRQVILLTAGSNGVGKSTFVNNLLNLKGEKRAPAKHSPNSVTTEVKSFYQEDIGSDILVRILDTPGFESGRAAQQNEKESLAMISVSTDGKADLLLYFLSLCGGRFDETLHRNIIKKLNDTFSNNIWKRALLILTHADVVLLTADEDDDGTLPNLVDGYCHAFEKALETCGVSPIAVQSVLTVDDYTVGESVILAVPVGKKPSSPPEWKNSVLKAIAKKVDVDVIPAMLEIQGMRWKWVVHYLQKYGIPLGVVGGSGIGIGVGAKVGAKVGAAIGGIGGAGVGALAGAATGYTVDKFGGKLADKFSGTTVQIAHIIDAREKLEQKKKHD